MDKKHIIIWLSVILLIFMLFYFNQSCYLWDGKDTANGEPIGGYECEILYLPMFITMAVFSLLYFGLSYYQRKKK
ncbi:MAG: hypothetical protein NDI94_02195 [Candidatus Woesearchaeota archaeon]|nr:hypothetical protein [Candidatus Woesearchaeota archaeon]